MNNLLKILESQCWESRKFGPSRFNHRMFAVLIAQHCSEIAREVMMDEGSTMSWEDLGKIQEQIKNLGGGW